MFSLTVKLFLLSALWFLLYCPIPVWFLILTALSKTVLLVVLCISALTELPSPHTPVFFFQTLPIHSRLCWSRYVLASLLCLPGSSVGSLLSCLLPNSMCVLIFHS